MFVALTSLHSPVVFSYKVLSRFYESFDHPSVRNGCEWCTYPVLLAGATYHVTNFVHKISLNSYYFTSQPRTLGTRHHSKRRLCPSNGKYRHRFVFVSVMMMTFLVLDSLVQDAIKQLLNIAC